MLWSSVCTEAISFHHFLWLKNSKGLVWLTNFGPKLLTAARLPRPGRKWNVLASVVRSKPFTWKSSVWVRPSPQQSTVAASHGCSPSGKMGWWSHICAWQKSPALIDTLYGRSHSKKKQEQNQQINTLVSTGPGSPLNGRMGCERKDFWSKSYNWVRVVGIGDSVQAVPFRHTENTVSQRRLF